MLEILNRVSDGLNRICQVLAVVSIVVLVIIVLTQIFTRSALGFAITWVDGTARYLLIWSTFLGAAIAAKESGHIQLTFVLDKLHGKGRIVGECIVSLLFMILAGVVIKAGIAVVGLVLPQKSDSLPISVAWIYGAIPLCQTIIFYHLFVDMLDKCNELIGNNLLKMDKKGGIR